MKQFYFFLSIILFTTMSCRMSPLLHGLFLTNNSDVSIKFYLNDDVDYKAVYPDTLITDFESRIKYDSSIVRNKRIEIVSVPKNWTICMPCND